MNEKYCAHCSTAKPVSMFGPLKSNKDGLRNYCKPCTTAIKKEQRIRHKEKVAKLLAAMVEAPPDEAKALPRTHTYFKEPYVPEQHQHRSDGNKHIKSRGMRC